MVVNVPHKRPDKRVHVHVHLEGVVDEPEPLAASVAPKQRTYRKKKTHVHSRRNTTSIVLAVLPVQPHWICLQVVPLYDRHAHPGHRIDDIDHVEENSKLPPRPIEWMSRNEAEPPSLDRVCAHTTTFTGASHFLSQKAPRELNLPERSIEKSLRLSQFDCSGIDPSNIVELGQRCESGLVLKAGLRCSA